MCVAVHSLVGAAAEVPVAETCEEASGDGRQQRSELDVQPRSDHVILVQTDPSRQIHDWNPGHTGALQDRPCHSRTTAAKAHGIYVCVCVLAYHE